MRVVTRHTFFCQVFMFFYEVGIIFNVAAKTQCRQRIPEEVWVSGAVGIMTNRTTPIFYGSMNEGFISLGWMTSEAKLFPGGQEIFTAANFSAATVTNVTGTIEIVGVDSKGPHSFLLCL